MIKAQHSICEAGKKSRNSTPPAKKNMENVTSEIILVEDFAERVACLQEKKLLLGT